MTFTAVFRGGPRDGETFTHDGQGVVEFAEVTDTELLTHRYVATNGDRDVYEHRSVSRMDLLTVRAEHRRQTTEWLDRK